jgi:hypothetical protein
LVVAAVGAARHLLAVAAAFMDINLPVVEPMVAEAVEVLEHAEALVQPIQVVVEVVAEQAGTAGVLVTV